MHRLAHSYVHIWIRTFVFPHLISRDLNSCSSVKQREVWVKDPYSVREEFPRHRQQWWITWGMEAKDREAKTVSSATHPPSLVPSLCFSVAAFRCNLPSLETVDLDEKNVAVVQFTILSIQYVTSPQFTLPFLPFCCHCVPLNLRASHPSSCVLSSPLSLVFRILSCSTVSSLFSGFRCLSLFPSDLPLLPSISTCHCVSLVCLPPFGFLLLSLSFLVFFLSVGRRWNLGDQWREHQGHEARESHRAYQEWRPARPSGAQEGWRLCARIWWVNLRKHSLLPHLHALSQGTPSGRWWVEGERTILPSQDPSPIPGTNPPGRGRGLVWCWCLSGGGHSWPLGFWGEAGVKVLLWVLLPPPAVTCSQFPCHPAVTFHLLATEKKHSAGTLQKGGGSDFSASMNTETVYRVWMTRVVKVNVSCG